MPSQFFFPPYNGTVNFGKFDVIYDTDGVYYYSTRDANVGSKPLQLSSYAATSWTRTENVTTAFFTATGALPTFTAGSLVRVAGLTGSQTPNYSGMVLNGGAGFVTYINPGWPQASVPAAGATVSAAVSPSWTTGFFFIPTYNTKIETNNKPIVAQFGDMYAQRQPGGLNTFEQSVGHVFINRGKREMQAITNFVQDKAGAYAFEILIPDESITNQPNQKYVAAGVSTVPVSFQLFDVSVTLTRDFNF